MTHNPPTKILCPPSLQPSAHSKSNTLPLLSSFRRIEVEIEIYNIRAERLDGSLQIVYSGLPFML